jgi:hypothetical protein
VSKQHFFFSHPHVREEMDANASAESESIQQLRRQLEELQAQNQEREQRLQEGERQLRTQQQEHEQKLQELQRQLRTQQQELDRKWQRQQQLHQQQQVYSLDELKALRVRLQPSEAVQWPPAEESDRLTLRAREVSCESIRSFIAAQEVKTDSSKSSHTVAIISGLSGLGKTRFLRALPSLCNVPPAGIERKFIFVTHNNIMSPSEALQHLNAESQLAARIFYAVFVGIAAACDFDSFARLLEKQLRLRDVLTLVSEARVDHSKRLSIVLSIDEVPREAAAYDGQRNFFKAFLSLISCLTTTTKGFGLSTILAGISASTFKSIAVGSTMATVRCLLPLLTFIDGRSILHDFILFGGRISDAVMSTPAFLLNLFLCSSLPGGLVDFLNALQIGQSVQDAFDFSSDQLLTRMGAENTEQLIEAISYALCHLKPDDDLMVKWTDLGVCHQGANRGIEFPYMFVHLEFAQTDWDLTDRNPISDKAWLRKVTFGYLCREVDHQMYKLDGWSLLERFGAAFHALRLQAFAQCQPGFVRLSDLLPGACLSPSMKDISVWVDGEKLFQLHQMFSAAAKLYNTSTGFFSFDSYTHCFDGENNYVMVCAPDEKAIGILIVFHKAKKRDLDVEFPLVLFDQRKFSSTRGLKVGMFENGIEHCTKMVDALKAQNRIAANAIFVFGIVNPLFRINAIVTNYLSVSPDHLFAIGNTESPTYHGVTFRDHPLLGSTCFINDPLLPDRHIISRCLPDSWEEKNACAILEYRYFVGPIHSVDELIRAATTWTDKTKLPSLSDEERNGLRVLVDFAVFGKLPFPHPGEFLLDEMGDALRYLQRAHPTKNVRIAKTLEERTTELNRVLDVLLVEEKMTLRDRMWCLRRREQATKSS